MTSKWIIAFIAIPLLPCHAVEWKLEELPFFKVDTFCFTWMLSPMAEGVVE